MRNNYINSEDDYNNSNEYRRRMQTHVHEFEGSTRFAEEGRDRHNHRFAGVTGEAIKRGNSHVHRLATNTDFVDHHHQICDITGLAIPVGEEKHVHLVKGCTTTVYGHRHEFVFATLIEAPAVKERDRDRDCDSSSNNPSDCEFNS